MALSNINSNSAVDALLVTVSLWMQPVPLPREAVAGSAPVVHLEIEHKPGSKFWPYKELKGAAYACGAVFTKIPQLLCFAASSISFMELTVSSHAYYMSLLVVGLHYGCTIAAQLM